MRGSNDKTNDIQTTSWPASQRHSETSQLRVKKKQFKIILAGFHFFESPGSNDDARFRGQWGKWNPFSWRTYVITSAVSLIKTGWCYFSYGSPFISVPFYVSRPQGLLPYIPYESSTGTQTFLPFTGCQQIGLACHHKNLDTGADGVVAQSDSITHTPSCRQSW